MPFDDPRGYDATCAPYRCRALAAPNRRRRVSWPLVLRRVVLTSALILMGALVQQARDRVLLDRVMQHAMALVRDMTGQLAADHQALAACPPTWRAAWRSQAEVR